MVEMYDARNDKLTFQYPFWGIGRLVVSLKRSDFRLNELRTSSADGPPLIIITKNEPNC